MMITCAVVLAKQKISSDVETGTAQCKARAANQQIFEEFATSMNLNLKVFILLLASLPPSVLLSCCAIHHLIDLLHQKILQSMS